eukprot:Skav228972  [mRNA]  locus=scaffold671:153010:156257:+ [translate_table: standard]
MTGAIWSLSPLARCIAFTLRMQPKKPKDMEALKSLRSVREKLGDDIRNKYGPNARRQCLKLWPVWTAPSLKSLDDPLLRGEVLCPVLDRFDSALAAAQCVICPLSITFPSVFLAVHAAEAKEIVSDRNCIRGLDEMQRTLPVLWQTNQGAKSLKGFSKPRCRAVISDRLRDQIDCVNSDLFDERVMKISRSSVEQVRQCFRR